MGAQLARLPVPVWHSEIWLSHARATCTQICPHGSTSASRMTHATIFSSLTSDWVQFAQWVNVGQFWFGLLCEAEPAGLGVVPLSVCLALW